MIGQIVWATVLSVLLVAVAVGWAMRGAMEVREKLASTRRRRRIAAVRPDFLRLLSGRQLVFASAFLLALALLFFARSMGRGLPLMGAVVLALAYALLCAMLTGFTVWVRAQRVDQDALSPIHAGSFHWAAWVGVGVGAVAIAYLVVDLVTTLTA